MSEQYSRLFALPNDLYTAGSPVVIAEGVFLKNNQTGNILAQLKFRNIHHQRVKAVKVRVFSLDTDGCRLGAAKEHQYFDLSAPRGTEFGQKTAILLDGTSAQNFSVELAEVTFADDSVWTGDAGDWQPLPALTTLLDEAQDENLVTQYRMTYGKQCGYAPCSHEDLWFCACGAVNHAEERTCCNCGLEFAKLNAVQWTALKQAADRRLTEEQAVAQKQEAALKKKKRRKVTAVILALLILVLAAAAAFYAVEYYIPATKYAKAESHLAAGQYDEAIAVFTDLGDYQDAAARVPAAKYAKADACLAAGQYDEAIAVLIDLGDYQDAAARVPAAKYAKADACLAAGQYDEAISTFGELGAYNDSETRRAEATCAKAEALFANGDFLDAAALFASLDGYGNSEAREKESRYQQGIVYLEAQDFDSADAIFEALGTYKDSIAKRHRHQYTESVTTEPGHEAPGVKTFTCVCEYSYTEEIPPVGHTYETSLVVDATCTVPGSVTYTCACGASYTEEVPVTDHSYSSKVTKDATCEKSGTRVYTCSCGDTYSVTIKATSHSYSAATCTAAAKCKYCGKQQSPALGHTTTTGTCDRCGYNFTPTVYITNADTAVSNYHNVSLPKGKYKITVSVYTDSADPASVTWSVACQQISCNVSGSGRSSVTQTFQNAQDVANASLVFQCPSGGISSYFISIAPVN
ncbi:MAG: tetratricopeptide repeat protein [Clostridia bacterium]|nr:tetratricopeptide repeat protein [Clostridia bacterium]